MENVPCDTVEKKRYMYMIQGALIFRLSVGKALHKTVFTSNRILRNSCSVADNGIKR